MAELPRLAVFLFSLPILAVALATGLMSRASPDEQQVLSLIRSVAVSTAALGTAAIILTLLACRAAREKREWLIRLYGPVVSAAKGAAPFFIVSQVAVLVSLAAFFEVMLLGRVYGLLTIPSVIAALLWVGYRSADVSMSGWMPMSDSLNVAASGVSPLGVFLERTAAAVGVSAPQGIVVGFERAFSVTETSNHLIGKPQGRTLYLSLPLCRILSRPEVGAVIARELAGFKGVNSRLAKTVLPLQEAAKERLHVLRVCARDSGWVWLATGPDIAILAFVTEAMSGAVQEAFRQRELEADQVGAAAAGRQNLVSALLKQYVFAPVWNEMLKDVKRTVEEGVPVSGVNLSARYATLVRERATESAFREASDRILSSQEQIDGPSLVVRLAALGVSPSDASASVLAVTPHDAAIDLIEGYEELEMELCRDYPLEIFLDLAEIGEAWDKMVLEGRARDAKRN